MAEKLLTDEEAWQVLQKINAFFPNVKSPLHWDSLFHLLCAVLLSAQTTDKRVNEVMVQFSRDFPEPKILAQASIKDIEADIKSLGLYHNKAKHLKALAQKLLADYDGQVPQDKKALLRLPGVGEKTANVVLAEGFGVPAIAVDTHVARIAKKFKIVPAKATPHQVETRLEQVVPRDLWIQTHRAMILFGRQIMPARAKDPNPYHYLQQEK